MTHARGWVSLVGAGPGDARLITVAGLEAIQRAEVVIYDKLVDPALLRKAPASAELIFVGKQGGGTYTPQEEINALILDRARRGKHVVRLKGGDPLVFARGAEELEALASAGIKFEVIPGVTAALAAAATAAIPLTHRHESSALLLVTGHEDPNKEASVDWKQLAQVHGTLVVYMARAKLGAIAQELLDGGKEPSTPVAFIQWAGSHRQATHVTTLAEATAGAPAWIGTPMLAIVGRVVEHRQELAWFERRPLFGQSLLLLRSGEQNDTWASAFEELGAEVLTEPAMSIERIEASQEIDRAIGDLQSFDFLVFASRNGVQHFFEHLLARGNDARALSGTKLVAVGPATADELLRHGVRADLVPTDFRAEGMAEELVPQAAGKRFLLVRANRGRQTLEEALQPHAAEVRSVPFYQQVDIEKPSRQTEQALREGKIDAVILSSSNVARSFIRWLDEEMALVVRGKTRLVTISPLTSQAVRELGFEVAAEAGEASQQGVLAAVMGMAK